MERVARVHGKGHPELMTMRDLYAGTAAELLEHMNKEEQVLFPRMRAIQKVAAGAIASTQLSSGSIQHLIQQMESEHESVGAELRQLRALSRDYELPTDACNSYRALWAGLAHLEEALHRHIHLENFVLQPLAVKYESSACAG